MNGLLNMERMRESIVRQLREIRSKNPEYHSLTLDEIFQILKDKTAEERKRRAEKDLVYTKKDYSFIHIYN